MWLGLKPVVIPGVAGPTERSAVLGHQPKERHGLVGVVQVLVSLLLGVVEVAGGRPVDGRVEEVPAAQVQVARHHTLVRLLDALVTHDRYTRIRQEHWTV